ncbi:MAG: ROK family protein [Chloroflexota bacterium]
MEERNTNQPGGDTPILISRESPGLRSETVRRSNLSAIVRQLHGRGPQSRSELVARTGLTRSAIRGLIAEFVAANLVVEERAALAGLPGRPSPVVVPQPGSAVVLAVDIRVDSLAVAIVGLGGEVLEQRRIDRPRDRIQLDDLLGDLRALTRELTLLDASRDALIGIGVSVVGLVRRADGWVATAPNLGWRDIQLAEQVGAALDLRLPVHVGNEADLGALAELRRGAARGADDMVFISGEVGVGGGFIVDGKPLTGVVGFAGEVGHMPINPGGGSCRCGSMGCWEVEVGEEALLRGAGRPADGGREAVDAVVAAAEAGEPAALASLERVGRWLGIGLALLVNLLNPRVIVLGGLFGRVHPFVRSTMQAELDRRALPAARGLMRVTPAALGDDASLLGAAELAFEPFLADPAAWLGPRSLLATAAGA